MRVSKTNHVAFWICTALVAFFMISGGLANVFLQASIAGFLKLGYPAYFARILGVWTAAVAGDMSQPWSYVGHIAAPLVIAAMALVSWAFRPQNRVLGGAVVGRLGRTGGMALAHDAVAQREDA